jgi:hypothetical protein
LALEKQKEVSNDPKASPKWGDQGTKIGIYPLQKPWDLSFKIVFSKFWSLTCSKEKAVF